ncbi:hypothetical protein OFO01_07295 [Campylobacter sp. JMF_01 NE2]|uniref:hypothetical protein n=1 Tax=unclassified Campylobacter TaxID=2593542 RepID=UPI0022E9BDD8|nr:MULTISPECIES: hypothetical protein [unclassified Campylobacter]MDA3053231.1 hypothetical protein [Campylobacter sp. JMF_03 NE3]MDA3067586.1 hypothetical protein [Campylobacter sp. JMF_01 NE2]
MKLFYGKEISKYGLQHGKVDYYCLSKCFQSVICNNIEEIDPSIFENVVNGEIDEQTTIFQYYLIDENGKFVLKHKTNEIVMYSELLDCYVWGVTHCGTSWDCVLTEIPINDETTREVA